jgi:shikimate kinase
MTMWLTGIMGSGKTSSGMSLAADHVIDTSGKTIAQVANEIVSLWAS